MKADTHLQEADRLAALRSYDILDTGKEQDYDDIVALAAAICGTEASTITFVDADRQWFKAAIGMPPDPAPIEMAICAHTMVGGEFVEIEDTQKDPRTADNPGCQGANGVRFYAGTQLIGEKGLPIGTLCVLGWKPGKLTPVQREALRVLGHQVVRLLELRVALKTAAILRDEVNHRVKNSLQLIASLISMQRRATGNDEVRQALGQTRNQVLAFASLHEAMQQTESGTAVGLRHLIVDLCGHLRRYLPAQVDLVQDVEDVEVSATVASSVAVIVNEFVNNSIKHGFAEGQAGTIRFEGRMGAAGRLALWCRNDGSASAGMPDEMRSGGLGMVAMRACAEQINGTLTVGDAPTGFAMLLEFDPRAA